MQVLRVVILIVTATFPFCNLLTVDVEKKRRASDVSLWKATGGHDFQKWFVGVCALRDLRTSVSLPHERAVFFVLNLVVTNLSNVVWYTLMNALEASNPVIVVTIGASTSPLVNLQRTTCWMRMAASGLRPLLYA